MVKNKMVSGKTGEEQNLYILKELIEKAGKENKQLYCMFLDIEKAYDTVNRKIMWELVERLGFDEHIRKILQSMYRNTIAINTIGMR